MLFMPWRDHALLNYTTEITRVSSEIPFSEGLCRIEASHLLRDTIRLTFFCEGESFIGTCFPTDYNLFFFTFFLPMKYFFSFFKLEMGLKYVTFFYSKYNCTRCYYLYSLILLRLVRLMLGPFLGLR